MSTPSPEYVQWEASASPILARTLVARCSDVRDWGVLLEEAALLGRVDPPVVLLDLGSLEDSDGGFRAVLVRLGKALQERGVGSCWRTSAPSSGSSSRWPALPPPSGAPARPPKAGTADGMTGLALERIDSDDCTEDEA
jgi:hypothetical protein